MWAVASLYAYYSMMWIKLQVGKDIFKNHVITAEFGIKSYRAYLEWSEEERAILGRKAD